MMCSSGKNAFPSMRWALLLAQHDNQRRPARARLRAYRCPECEQWHLTSQPQHVRPLNVTHRLPDHLPTGR